MIRSQEIIIRAAGWPDRSCHSALLLVELLGFPGDIAVGKENMAKERAKHSSKSKKEDSQDDEVGSKRVHQQAKRDFIDS
jgi:hypothetical protein